VCVCGGGEGGMPLYLRLELVYLLAYNRNVCENWLAEIKLKHLVWYISVMINNTFFFFKKVCFLICITTYLKKNILNINIRRVKSVKCSCILNNHIFNDTILFYDPTTHSI